AADGPGRPHVARLTHPRVVASLAVRKADRMDRRQVDDVEAERGDLGDPALRVAEGAVTTRLRALRAGEELVPGRETRLRAVHDDGKEDRARGVPRVDGAVHQLEQGLRKGDPEPRVLVRLHVLQHERRLLEGLAVRGRREGNATPHEGRPFEELGGDVLTRLDALL